MRAKTFGSITLIIEKDTPIIKISEKEKKDLVSTRFANLSRHNPELSRNDVKRGIIFPKYKPFFQDILDDGERIYVRGYIRQNKKDRSIEFDIFDADGFFLFKAMMPFSPIKIKDGYAYQVKTDSNTGYRKVIRYKIKNWDQIKEGI